MARDLIVIPARWGSTRLPGKPLVPVAGRALLARVIDMGLTAARLAGDTDVMVATDDARIVALAEQCGVAAAMTDAAITTGSGRVLAAVRTRADAPATVVNLQGDAPFTPPAIIARLLTTIRDAAEPVVTPVVPLGWDALDSLRRHKLTSPFSGTTAIVGPDDRAVWFSKTIIPAIRNEERLRLTSPSSPVFQHVGLYAYRLDALARFEATPPTPYERLEELEQLRFLEMGMAILAVRCDSPPLALTGIDTLEDVRRAEALIAARGEPLAA